jgi:hypothetical protein
VAVVLVLECLGSQNAVVKLAKSNLSLTDRRCFREQARTSFTKSSAIHVNLSAVIVCLMQTGGVLNQTVGVLNSTVGFPF